MKPWLNSALEPLVGRTVEEVRVSDDAVYFRCGTQWLCATVDGDCCSVSWVYRVRVPQLPFTVVAVVTDDADDVDPDDGLGRQESDSVYGIGLWTSGGVVSIVYRNSSNGFYGGWMETAVECGAPPADAVAVSGEVINAPEGK